MPYWSQIVRELGETLSEGNSTDFDSVRRKYLSLFSNHAGRDTILYASAWVQKPEADVQDTSITDEDLHALMEVSAGLNGKSLDLIMHSPGGSVVAAEAFVSYLRSRYDDIRVIVPNLAMSAAAMIVCAADRIVMGKHSFLGPTDPQIPIATRFGVSSVAAIDVIRTFDQSQSEPNNLAMQTVWLQMLQHYGPDILRRCQRAVTLSEELVTTWLAAYMFKCDQQRAKTVANSLATGEDWRSHGRHITRATLEAVEFKIDRLECDDVLQDLVLSVFHATTLFFELTTATKIVENHVGRAYMKHDTQRALIETE